MTKPRTVSEELPRGLLFQKGSACLYVIVPSPERGSSGRPRTATTGLVADADVTRARAVVRKATGIPYQGLATDEQRVDAISRGSAIVRLLDGMLGDERYHEVLRAIRDGTISIREVIDVGLMEGRHALKTRVEARCAAERDVDLQPFIGAFAAHRFCLHPNPAKRGKAMRPSTRAQQVSHVRRYLSWAAISVGLSAEENGVRPMSLLQPSVFAPYLSVIAERTVEERHGRGEAVDKDTGARAARDAYGALSQFRRFLAEHLQLADVPNVTAGLFRPNATKKRDRHLTSAEVKLLVDELFVLGQREAAVYCAILHSSGLDTTDVATMYATQIERDAALWMVHSTSLKSDARYRLVPMYEGFYALVGAYVDERIALAGPSAPLFPTWEDWRNERDPYLRAHQSAVASLVHKGHSAFTGYQPRDSRHTLAVAMARARVSARIIGLQLGTAETTIARVYANWLQSPEEWQDAARRLQGSYTPSPMQWERIAARVSPPRVAKTVVASRKTTATPAFRRRPMASLRSATTANTTPS